MSNLIPAEFLLEFVVCFCQLSNFKEHQRKIKVHQKSLDLNGSTDPKLTTLLDLNRYPPTNVKKSQRLTIRLVALCEPPPGCELPLSGCIQIIGTNVCIGNALVCFLLYKFQSLLLKLIWLAWMLCCFLCPFLSSIWSLYLVSHYRFSGFVGLLVMYVEKASC